MKTASCILIVLSLFTSCDSKPKQINETLDSIRKDFAKDAKEYNEKTLAWEGLVDSIYKLSDTNQTLAIKIINNLLSQDSLLGRYPNSELHFIKGDIYYRIDSFNKAIEKFSFAGGKDIDNSPKVLAARAGVFIKNKQFDKAFIDLTKAAEINYDYYWNVGNYFELIEQKDSAILNYERLYFENKDVYRYCKDRIEELSKNKPKLLTELVYKDRERVHILLHGVK